jgi:hypothetical protein
VSTWSGPIRFGCLRGSLVLARIGLERAFEHSVPHWTVSQVPNRSLKVAVWCAWISRTTAAHKAFIKRLEPEQVQVPELAQEQAD